MRKFGLMAVGIACLPPVTWTIQGYYYKKLITAGRFSPFDLAWDGAFFSYFQCLIFHFVYMGLHDIDFSLYLQGSCVGCFQVTGQFLMLLSYQTGPGGAIQALINLQTCWQTGFDAILFDQIITSQQWIGMVLGLTSALLISVGDNMIECCCPAK